MMRVAVMSAWHVHTVGYCQYIANQKDACLKVLWDDNIERGKEVAARFGIDFEPDLDKMLAREDVDAVLCCTPTTAHHDLIIKCANAKKHIFTEKALAPTVKECKEIIEAIEKNGVKFVISYPQLTSGPVQYAKKAIDEGLLGHVSYLRLRNAHAGASKNWLPAYWYDMTASGGGAMMDLGCHPNYIASYLLGKPVRINSIFNQYCAPEGEDNAVSVIEFENKAIAVIETGFVTPYTDSTIDIEGTEGTIRIKNHKEIRIFSEHLPVKGWIEPAELPEERPQPLRDWIDAVEYDKPIFNDTVKALALTELLESEYIANNTGKTVVL